MSATRRINDNDFARLISQVQKSVRDMLRKIGKTAFVTIENLIIMNPSIQIASNFEALYPDSSARATGCAMNLVLTADLLVKHIGPLLQPFNLTSASVLVLSILADSKSPLPPNEIADRLIVSRATVTDLLDSLERQGYMRRIPHPSYRRMITE
jgi:hypothetical protein